MVVVVAMVVVVVVVVVVRCGGDFGMVLWLPVVTSKRSKCKRQKQREKNNVELIESL